MIVQNSVLDREQAYAEARARIFGEEGTPDCNPSSPSYTISTEVPVAVAPMPSQHLIDSSTGGQGKQGRAAVNPGAWKVKKVTMRNKDAERYDPDFTRHSPRGEFPPLMNLCIK